MSPILFFIKFFTCPGIGKIFLQINSAAVAFIYQYFNSSVRRVKTKICFGCTFMYYMQVLSVPLLCNEGIVNILVLCSIPLA